MTIITGDDEMKDWGEMKSWSREDYRKFMKQMLEVPEKISGRTIYFADSINKPKENDEATSRPKTEG